jgi:hypothetical protein
MTIYDLVKELLTLKPALRDSDRKLIWSVWITENKIVGGKISLEDFSTATSTESIRRARQKVQEEHPELCSSPLIQKIKDDKEEDKGTFVYREPVTVAEPLTMDYSARMEMLSRAKEELIKKGVIKK